MKKSKRKALILLSGGLDSATLLYWAKKKYECIALSFEYGQKHKRELISAKKIARCAGCRWICISLTIPYMKSSLTDKRLSIPHRQLKKISMHNIPSTYVPGRNTIFLSYALSLAESLNIKYIFIGANAIDFSGYPDCRPDYIKAMQRVSRLGTKTGRQGNTINIGAPLINKTKKEIIRMGLRLGVPYALTWSCYNGGNKPCGTCDACVIRNRGFEEAGIKTAFGVQRPAFRKTCTEARVQ